MTLTLADIEHLLNRKIVTLYSPLVSECDYQSKPTVFFGSIPKSLLAERRQGRGVRTWYLLTEEYIGAWGEDLKDFGVNVVRVSGLSEAKRYLFARALLNP